VANTALSYEDDNSSAADACSTSSTPTILTAEQLLQDLALLGTRGLALMLADRSDGYRHTLDLARPFFPFDTRWSWAAARSRTRAR
jgi:hypothetical protein